MKYGNPRLVFGATLFATPGMKGGGHMPILLTVVCVVVAIGILVVLVQRSWKPTPPGSEPSDGHGWGRRPWRPRPDPPRRPRGGLPLDDAVTAKARLRGAGRLADMRPPRSRRPAREPEPHPVRERTPS